MQSRKFFRVGLLLTWLLMLASFRRIVAAQTPTPTPSYKYVETMPVFPGGVAGENQAANSQRLIKFLNDSLFFPPQARRDGVQGKVFVAFAVDSAGRTRDLKLVKGLRADVDEATLRNVGRLERIQWQPGTQNGRPVRVAFTVPISYNLSPGLVSDADSLDRGPFQKITLPLLSWNDDRQRIPAGKGLIYGSCLQRLAGSSSFGTSEYVRLVNLTTGKAIRLSVKPALKSSRENAFCYALPAGRYALFLYEFPDPVWGPYRLHIENIRKPALSASAAAGRLSATRYQFTVATNKLHYVGTWNLANENEPRFLNEKSILDNLMKSSYPGLKLDEASESVPK